MSEQEKPAINSRVTREYLLDLDGSERTPVEWSVAVFAVLFGLWHIATSLFINEQTIWQNAIHFGGFALLASVIHTGFQRQSRSQSALIADLVYAY